MNTIHKTKEFIRSLYHGNEVIPLHRPVFSGNERKYLLDCIDSNFVSSAGQQVNAFEEQVAGYTKVKSAVATMNGTSALHASLMLSGVGVGDEVITQALTFVATCNAIRYLGANPIFVDVDKDTMGLSPASLDKFLDKNIIVRDGRAINRVTNAHVKACVPMHTFGHPCRIEEIVSVCEKYSIPVIEDAAESLGSLLKERHTGSFGKCAILSFNGNKIITTGGGGMIITNDKKFARKAKHITTTAKVSSDYEFIHDEIGFNYRLPSLNAALGCAQMEKLEEFIREKRLIADKYRSFFGSLGVDFFSERVNTRSNYWLNAIVLESKKERDLFLKGTNEDLIMTRPIWRLMSKLPMFKKSQTDDLVNSVWLEDRVVNIPSSVPDNKFN